jgi:small-conductance mechanosensitive channel
VNAQGYEFVWAGVKTLGMNSIDYEISYEVSAAQSKRNAQATNDMLLEVLDYLKKAGIKLASPTNMAA